MSAFEYRNRRLKKLKVSWEDVSQSTGIRGGAEYVVVIDEGNSGFAFTLMLFPPNVNQDLDVIACKFAKCVILDESYRSYVIEGVYKKILVADSPNIGSQAELAARYDWRYDSYGVLTVNHPIYRRLTIEEGKLGRRLYLDWLYTHTETTRAETLEQAHFPIEVMEREINSLNASEYVAHNMTKEVSFLTAKGREYFESDPWIGSNNVFIIAACQASTDEDRSAHETVLNTYKDYFKSLDSVFNPIFQEHEEPEKNIYVDIFNYIDECAFVIADITYDRPNCYVEIGYALARGKHVIGYMQKEYFDKKAKEIGGSKIPFDLFPINFFEYSNHNLDDLKKSF